MGKPSASCEQIRHLAKVGGKRPVSWVSHGASLKAWARMFS
jgi:hypothetical protein